jgi:hypothetical protein
MPLEADNLKHWIDHFYGYGSWDAPIWFVSHEDGGGDLPEDVAEKLDHFRKVHPLVAGPTLCDIRALYKHATLRINGPKADIYSNLFDYRFGNNGLLNGVWKNLIAFAHEYKGEQLHDILTYQRTTFARSNEALIKLYPLPAPHNHAWYYSWLDMPQFPFLKSRELYEDHLFPLRMKVIVGNIIQHKPGLVLMYGMSNINAIKASFPSVSFKMVKAEKLKTPQHHRAQLGATTLIITTQIPALRHGRTETGFDWMEFGKLSNK